MQKIAIKSTLITLSLLISNACTPPAPASRGVGKNCGSNSTATEELKMKMADGSLAVAVNYTDSVAPILDKYCTTCHSADGGQKPALDTFAAAKSGYASSIAAIDKSSMPSSDPKVTAEEVKILKSWSSGGFLEKASGASGSTSTSSADSETESGTPSSTSSSSADGTSGC